MGVEYRCDWCKTLIYEDAYHISSKTEVSTMVGRVKGDAPKFIGSSQDLLCNSCSEIFNLFCNEKRAQSHRETENG